MPLKGKFCSVVLALLMFSVMGVPSQEGAEPILASDLLKLKTMSQIDVSPDGTKAVFVLTSMGKDDGDKYRYFRHLWMIDLDDPSTPVQLTYGDRNDGSPTWSPDGTKTAFVRLGMLYKNRGSGNSGVKCSRYSISSAWPAGK